MIFQIYDKTFGDERFCINAASLNEAKAKLSKWCSHHGFDTDTRRSFCVQEVSQPKYSDNIHNEWV